jgi:hypothetical protein
LKNNQVFSSWRAKLDSSPERRRHGMTNPNGHGGARPGAGRPRRELAAALENDVHKSKIKTVRKPEPAAGDGGASNIPTVPECRAYLTEEQKTGVELGAKEYFEELWGWLSERKCEHLFQPSYLQNFAMQQARYAQLERMLSRVGFVARNDKGTLVLNPIEKAAQDRLRIVNQMYFVIEAAVKANSTEPYGGLPGFEDPMERLLSGGT